jgi:hypothetical protein
MVSQAGAVELHEVESMQTDEIMSPPRELRHHTSRLSCPGRMRVNLTRTRPT